MLAERYAPPVGFGFNETKRLHLCAYLAAAAAAAAFHFLSRVDLKIEKEKIKKKKIQDALNWKCSCYCCACLRSTWTSMYGRSDEEGRSSCQRLCLSVHVCMRTCTRACAVFHIQLSHPLRTGRGGSFLNRSVLRFDRLSLGIKQKPQVSTP